MVDSQNVEAMVAMQLHPQGGARRPTSMPIVQGVLAEIFDYYGTGSISLKEKHMKSMKFQKMVLDADIIDESLTSAKVDLIFRKVCGNSPNMLLPQFLDAVVQCATTKFPMMGASEAVSQLFEEHFSSFSNPKESPIENLEEELMVVIEAGHGTLLTMYNGYFSCECSQHFKHKAASVSAQSQKAFVALLTDFEVTPDLVTKPVTFQVFRETSKMRTLPPELEERCPAQNPGGHFTYYHFLSAMVILARKIFPEELCPTDAMRVARLFERMDASKGRITFATKFPGNTRGSFSALRLLPDSLGLPDGVRRGARASLQGMSAKSADAMRRGSLRKSMSNPGLLESPTPQGGGRDLETMSMGQSQSSAPKSSIPMSQHLMFRGPSERLRRLIQQIFGYYAALGDPLNRTHIGTIKFNRFLRDCGLLSSDAQGAVSFRFNPGARNSIGAGGGAGGGPRLSRSGSDGAIRRNSNLVAVPETRRASRTDAFTVSASRKSVNGLPTDFGDGLPLKIFMVPPLSQVDADLLFVQVTKSQNDAAPTPERRRSSFASPQPVAKQKPASKKHMSMEAFERALYSIADRCNALGILGSDNGPVAEEIEAFEGFCDKVLVPLSEQLLEVQGQDVSDAAALMAQKDTVSLFEKVQMGVERIFQHYSRSGNEGGRPPHWTSESMVKFASDFELTCELSHLPLQKIFRDCVHVEYCAGHGRAGEMSLISFQLALVMLSQKTHTTATCSKLDRLVLLFQRMNTIAATNGFQGPAARHHSLLPGLPNTAEQGGDYLELSRPTAARRASAFSNESSWADVMR